MCFQQSREFVLSKILLSLGEFWLTLLEHHNHLLGMTPIQNRIIHVGFVENPIFFLQIKNKILMDFNHAIREKFFT